MQHVFYKLKIQLMEIQLNRKSLTFLIYTVMYIYIHKHIYIYIYLYLYMYVCMYVYSSFYLTLPLKMTLAEVAIGSLI